MNEYDLFDAMNGIDDDLLLRSESRPVRKIPIRRTLIAAAAVMLLAVTVFATPKLMELFFGGKLTQISESIYYVSDTIHFTINAEYRVDMTYPCAETAPETIEEYRLPSYFEENGWCCDYSYVDLGEPGFNTAYLFSIPGNPAYWVQFHQSPFSMDETRGSHQFIMNAGRTGLVNEREVTIGDFSGTMYIIEPSEAHGEAGMKNIVWSDGEYAYLMKSGYTIPDEMLAEIVLSLAPVKDISLYGEYYDHEIDDNHRIPIDTFYTLSVLPEGYELEERTWDVNNADQWWSSDDGMSIYLSQARLLSDENRGPSLSIDYTLADVMISLDPYEYETAEENGLLYHIVRHQGDTFAMWQTEDYVFMLRFNCQNLTMEEMLEHLRNIQPMPDFTESLTE